MSTSACQQCHRSVPASEQMYQMDDLIVCETCAGVSTAESELAAAVASRATGRGRRVVRRKPKSTFSTGAIAFAAAALLVAGGVGYFTWNGTLSNALNDQRKSMDGTDTHNALIDQYNTLVADGNKLATDRKYAAASQKLREARAVANATPKVKQAVDLARLETVIAHYDSLAAGKPTVAPGKSPAPAQVTDVAPPTPDNVRFMDKGATDTAAIAPAPTFDATPDSEISKTPDANVAGAKKAEAERQAKERQIDAYKVPK